MRDRNLLLLCCATILLAGCSSENPLPNPGPGPGPTPTNRVTVTLAGNGSGRVTSTPAGVIDCPAKCEEVTSDVTLQAQADAGSVFDNWSGDCQGTGTCQVQPNATNGDQSVTATFSLLAPAGGSTITWDGGGDGVSWTDPLNWNPDQVPAAQDTAVINTTLVRHAAPVTSTVYSIQADNVEVTNGTLAVTTDATIQNLTIDTDVAATNPAAFDIGGTLAVAGNLDMRSAALSGSGTVDASGQITWSGTRNDISVAQLNISGTAVASAMAPGAGMTSARSSNILCVGPGSPNSVTTITVQPNGLKILDDTDVRGGPNSFCPNTQAGGRVDIAMGGTLRAINTSSGTLIAVPFNNNGTVEIETGMEIAASGSHDGTFKVSASGFAPTLLVSGDVLFLGNSDIQVNTFVVAGTVSIAGTLTAPSTSLLTVNAALTIESGARVTGNILSLGGGRIVFQDAVDYADIIMQAGTLEINLGITVTTLFLSFQRGTLYGGGTLNVTDQLSMGIDADKTFDGITLVSGNFGSWIAGTVLGTNGAVLVNDGFFDISDVSNLTWNCNNTGGGMAFINNGTVVKTGSGTTNMTVNYSGTPVVVQQGVFNQSSC